MNKLKKYLINFIQRMITKIVQSWIIKIIICLFGIILIIMGAWCNFDNLYTPEWKLNDVIYIRKWKPDDTLFMWCLCTIPIMLGIYNLGKSCSEKYLNSLKNDEKDNTIKFLRETLLDKDRSYLKEQICDLFITLGYTMTERICIYSISDCKKHFECTSRYSTNPELTEYSERKQYPLENGIMGKVWRDGQFDGWIRDSDIPFKGKSQKSENTYYGYLLKEYKIPIDIAKNLRMNPVDIIAEVIRDHKNEAVAVIIFESSQKNKIDANKIQKIYNGSIKNRIVRTLENIKNPPNLGRNALEENM